MRHVTKGGTLQWVFIILKIDVPRFSSLGIQGIQQENVERTGSI